MKKFVTLITLTLSLLGTTACMAVKAQSSTENEIEYQGYDRNKPVPLLIALHGGMGNGKHFMKSTGLDKTAEKNNFIVVFPNGTARFNRGRYTWNAGSCCGYAFKKKIDDVGFIRKLRHGLLQRRRFGLSPGLRGVGYHHRHRRGIEQPRYQTV